MFSRFGEVRCSMLAVIIQFMIIITVYISNKTTNQKFIIEKIQINFLMYVRIVNTTVKMNIIIFRTVFKFIRPF